MTYEVDITIPGIYAVSGRVSSEVEPAGTVALNWGTNDEEPATIRNTTHNRNFERQEWDQRHLERGTHTKVIPVTVPAPGEPPTRPTFASVSGAAGRCHYTRFACPGSPPTTVRHRTGLPPGQEHQRSNAGTTGYLLINPSRGTLRSKPLKRSFVNGAAHEPIG